jgi:hypothetical protein
MAKLKEVLRAKTRHTNGQGMTAICQELNGLLLFAVFCSARYLTLV